MTFSKALEVLKAGGLVRRRGWATTGMFLILSPGSTKKVWPKSPYERALLATNQREGYVSLNPHIDFFTQEGYMQCGWAPTQIDILSDDWGIIDTDPDDTVATG